MNSPILTFSPDGGQHVYALTLSKSVSTWLVILAGIAVLGLALALVGAAWVVSMVLTFVLTASIETLGRLTVLALALFLIGLYVHLRSASRKPVSLAQDACI